MNVKCHPEQSARKDFPTRVVCGSGGAESKDPYYRRNHSVAA